MSRVAAYINPDPSIVQGQILDRLRPEIDEIVQISLTLSKSLGFLKNRLKTAFPKKCSKCGYAYETFEDFFYDTQEIANGTVSYPIVSKDFYLHRNCKDPCDTTLVVVFTDRRDESVAGLRRREVFERTLHAISHSFQISEFQARDALLTLLANQLTIRVQGDKTGKF